jgi:hypothetical protein
MQSTGRARRSAWIWLFASLASATIAFAPRALPARIADDLHCDGLNALVRAADARDARTACEGGG